MHRNHPQHHNDTTHTYKRTHQPHTSYTPAHPGVLDDLVAMAGNDPPDPIPNSAVKTPSAYDTAS